MSEKTRFALWAEKDTLKLVRDNYQQDNCKTQSEFIEKAVRFYTGYLHAKEDTYLPTILSDILEGTLGVMADRIGKLLFKQSVELGILSHIIAADTDVDQVTLQRLRGRCVDDMKGTNGQIQFRTSSSSNGRRVRCGCRCWAKISAAQGRPRAALL